MKNIHYGDIHTKFSTLFDITKERVPFISDYQTIERIKSDNYCIEGDIVFADASEDLDDVGKSIEIVNLNNERLLSGLHTLLARQIESKLIVGFGGYLFKSNGIRRAIKKIAHGAKVLGISARRLSGIDICFPTDKLEQQKIADCLSSLEHLITTQSQKLGALEIHKKGLMQQLFPAEGESVPGLRFLEFRDSLEWEEKILKNVCKMQAGKFISASEIYEKTATGLFPCFGGNGLRGFTKTFTHNGTYSLIGRQGALCGNVKLAVGKFHATEHAIVVTPFNSINLYWLYYELIRLNLNQFAIGQAQPGLSVETLGKLIVKLPEDELEQQKIADCLSSLEELISAQKRKLEVLKIHKKGLMQGLFPAVDTGQE